MSADAYELKRTVDQTEYTPPEPSPELPHRQNTQEILHLAQATYGQFRQAFRWNEQDADKLFERIAGSIEPPTDELHDKMIELYITSLSSSFVQDDARANYKFIFEKFTRNSIDVAGIQKLLIEHHLVDGDIDDEYVTKHLLMTISKMSMHQE